MAQHIVGQIHKLLIKNKKTIAVAESCSGGVLSSLLTRLSGSSQYFILGVVVYSNKAKQDILKIPRGLIAEHGAVSEQVAKEMARSVRGRAKTDISLAVTGIAGPTGGAPRKPKGTVFIALANKNKIICKKFLFTGKRSAVREKTALASLKMLRNML